MADLEQGPKWWLRYVIVPILVGGGVLGYFLRPSAPSNSGPPPTPPAEGSGNTSQGQRPMDFFLKWNTVIPGQLLDQSRFPDNDYNSCLQACENNAKCQAWDFGPTPLPAGVEFNCSLKLAVTGGRVEQKDVVSGYSSRYRQPPE